MKTEQIKVEYIDHMGSDLSVVNAARASFGKESEMVCDADGNPVLKPADANLIRFLATGYRSNEWNELLESIMSLCQGFDESRVKERLSDVLKSYKRKAQHWAPFAHPHATLRIQLPIFLARQFVKHQVGGVWSEESRRYISEEPEVWFPSSWHSRPSDIKQGSGDLIADQSSAERTARRATQQAVWGYSDLQGHGVAPEEARTVLPLNTMTTVVWTGSLLFWSRVCTQRIDSHAQLAAQELGRKIAYVVRPLYPVSWKELVE